MLYSAIIVFDKNVNEKFSKYYMNSLVIDLEAISFVLIENQKKQLFTLRQIGFKYNVSISILIKL